MKDAIASKFMLFCKSKFGAGGILQYSNCTLSCPSSGTNSPLNSVNANFYVVYKVRKSLHNV